MQILKFGGSSVENAANISKVADIIKNSGEKGRTAVVVSALGGITDSLLKTATLAAAGDDAYKTVLEEIEKRHIEVVKEIMPVTQQSSLLSLVKKMSNDIGDICNGIFLLGELSERTKDRVISYGEILSSQILSAKLRCMSLENEWKDSRELITTDSHFGKAVVDFGITNKKIEAYFSKTDAERLSPEMSILIIWRDSESDIMNSCNLKF